MKEGQKKIIIGNKGETIKKIGTLARKELMELFDCKIQLYLHAKVKEDWLEKSHMYEHMYLNFLKKVEIEKMKIAFQMDHIATINSQADSSFMLALEAQNRGFEIYHYTPQDLFMENGVVKANIQKLKLFKDTEEFYQLDDKEAVELNEFDIILIRQDPPLICIILLALICWKIANQVFFINHPTEIKCRRN